MKRILLAGVLGGIAMFVWTSVAHMALPLGTIGIRELPNETAVLDSLHASAGSQSGLYMYPGMGLGPSPSMKEMRAAMPDYEKKLATAPSGILIYHPPGRAGMTNGQLATEFASEMLVAILAVVLLSFTRLGSYGSRVFFVAVVGLIASLPTNVSYWNWYGFPGNYTTAYICIQIVGFLVTGLVAAAVLKGGASRSASAAA